MDPSSEWISMGSATLSSPRCQLDVYGGVRVAAGFPTSGSSSNAGYSFGSDGTSGMVSFFSCAFQSLSVKLTIYDSCIVFL